MKKLLLTILLLTTPAFAFEDYMVISNSAVKSVSVQDESVLDAKILFTIENERKVLIITPKKNGNTKIQLQTEDGQKNLKVTVKENNTEIINVPEGLNCFILDNPPQSYSIPEPPSEIKILEPPKEVR